jgi:hypothetical protein
MSGYLPDWATNEEGNNLFAEAVASGAIPSTLLYKSSGEKFLQKKAELGGDNFTHSTFKILHMTSIYLNTQNIHNFEDGIVLSTPCSI